MSSPQNSNNCLGKTSKNIILEFRDIVKLVGAECLSNASPNAVATLNNVISLSISPPPLSCVYFSPRRTFVVKHFRGWGLECSGDKKVLGSNFFGGFHWSKRSACTLGPSLAYTIFQSKIKISVPNSSRGRVSELGTKS